MAVGERWRIGVKKKIIVGEIDEFWGGGEDRKEEKGKNCEVHRLFLVKNIKIKFVSQSQE